MVVTLDSVRAWVIDAVRYSRSMAFFQSSIEVPIGPPDQQKDSPAMRRVDLGVMTDEQVANFIVEDYLGLRESQTLGYVGAYLRSGRAEEFDYPGLPEVDANLTIRLKRRDAELEVVSADRTRILHDGRDYGVPVEDSEYVLLVEKIARISRGALRPTMFGVRRSRNNEDIPFAHISFVQEGRRYEVSTMAGDWMNEGAIVSGINEILSRSDSPYRIYYCHDDNEDFTLVTLTPDEKAKLERERGWSFAKGYFDSEMGAAEPDALIDLGETRVKSKDAPNSSDKG